MVDQHQQQQQQAFPQPSPSPSPSPTPSPSAPPAPQHLGRSHSTNTHFPDPKNSWLALNFELGQFGKVRIEVDELADQPDLDTMFVHVQRLVGSVNSVSDMLFCATQHRAAVRERIPDRASFYMMRMEQGGIFNCQCDGCFPSVIRNYVRDTALLYANQDQAQIQIQVPGDIRTPQTPQTPGENKSAE